MLQQEQQWRFNTMSVGTVADPRITTLAKRVHFRHKQLCLWGFSVMVAGDSPSYRRGSVHDTMIQLQMEFQPEKGKETVDIHELLPRTERSQMLRNLSSMEKTDFARESAKAFCVDHMGILCCHNPENGDKELDAAVMQSTYEVYVNQCEGPDCVGVVSKTTFERVLKEVMEELDFKVRDKKTVSKCETCEFNNILK